MKKLKTLTTQAAPVRIWCHLYDSISRFPYNSTSATFVKLPPGSLIAQFKDAVKAEYDLPGYLQNVDSSDLLVYRNKDAFDKRYAPEMVEPLEEELEIDGLGASRKEALIVAFYNSGPKELIRGDLVSSEEIDASFNSYMRIGSQLKEDQVVNRLIEKIKYLDEKGQTMTSKNDRDSIPFIFLSGSSGVGKSQMAFTLMNRKDVKVHYFVCSPLDDSAKSIYKRYENVSEQFLDCIKSDFSEFDPDGFRGRLPSRACGLIVALVKGKKEFKPMMVNDGIQEIYSHLQKSGNNSQVNVVFLDEFPVLNGNLIYLGWMRNLFRELHLATICSSISNSTADLIRTSMSRGATNPSDWCFVFPRFPKFLSVTGNTLSEFQKYLINNSRPLFSNIFRQELSGDGNSDISSVLGSMGLRLHQMKVQKYKESFAYGQILFLMGCNHMRSYEDPASSFGESHFANLKEDGDFCLQILNGTVWTKGKVYSNDHVFPTVSFPDPKEDILLFLCLMGNKGYYPISDSECKERTPFKRKLMAIKEELKNLKLSFQLHGGNSEFWLSANGSHLEVEDISTAILSLCSHYEGLNGIEFGKFLSHVLYEFESLDSSLDTVSCKIEGYQDFSEITIPFLSAPCVPWPQELLGFDYNFSNLNRTLQNDRNTQFKKRIYFQTDTFSCGAQNGILSGECHDLDKNIDVSELEAILNRIPKDSVIHMVFLGMMQNRYYVKSRARGFEFFVKKAPHIANKLILQFDLKSKSLVPISGIPIKENTKFDGLVLFISIDQSERKSDDE